MGLIEVPLHGISPIALSPSTKYRGILSAASLCDNTIPEKS